jgi:hypothetical protein
MKGSGGSSPRVGFTKVLHVAGFGAARWIVIGVDEADWAMRRVGGGSLVRFGFGSPAGVGASERAA